MRSAAIALAFGGVLAAMSVSSAAAQAAAGPSAGGADTVVRQQKLEEELRRLNGRIEELEHRLQRIADDAAKRIGDLEAQLFELQGGDPSLLGAPAPLGGLASDAPAGGTGNGNAPQVAVSEQAAFDAAVRKIQTGDPAGGRAALSAFLQAYPGTPLQGPVQHWQAESWYLSGDYRRAAQVYLSNVTQFPKGDQASDSLIGLALSLEKLGQIDEACLTLAEAPRRSPNDAEAIARAASERERLQCPAPVQ